MSREGAFDAADDLGLRVTVGWLPGHSLVLP